MNWNRNALVAAAAVAVGWGLWNGTRPLEAGAPSTGTRFEGLAAVEALVDADRPYLLLDLGRARLELYHGAALLRSFPLVEVEVGRSRRLAPGDSPPAGPWRPTGLSPARRREERVLTPVPGEVPDPTGSVDWVPPTPESLNPDPRRIRLRYEGGLALELRAEGSSPSARASWMGGPFAVRAGMPPAELGLLYRALPDSVVLVVLAAAPE